MKKIVMFLIINLFGLLIVSLIVSNFKTNENNYIYYTIPKNYALYDDGQRNISIDVYTEENNSIISFIDKNSYKVEINNSEYKINDVNVTKRKDYFEGKTMYVYTFSFLLSNIHSSNQDDFDFIITNNKFKVIFNVGVLSIYRGDYEILEFKDLYGNYSYIDNELHLVGITIAFGKGYNTLNRINSGICFGRIDKIKKDTVLNSEIDIDKLDNSILNTYKPDIFYKLDNKDKYYFIPISYERLLLNINPCFIFEIDGKEYLLDNFYYLFNDISLSDYINLKKAGDVIYA